ncbi:MAG: YaaA family protein, partial [Myxococcota bacterium]
AILSGLYGLLRPLDLMQPYRLEMGTRLETDRGANLYAFWGDRITDQIRATLAGHTDQTLVNLASNEYFKSVKIKSLPGAVITPAFKEIRDGKPKMISFLAKKARGMMARHIIENRLESPEGLKSFTSGGYAYDEALSTDTTWTFTR